MKYKGLILFFAINELASIPNMMAGTMSPQRFMLSAGLFAVVLAFIGILMWLKMKWYHYIQLFVFLGLIASTAYFAGKAA